MASTDPTGNTLADRVHGAAKRRALPCHVWIGDDPAVLVAWERGDDGRWWGRVLHVAGGVGSESLIAAGKIRPAN